MTAPGAAGATAGDAAALEAARQHCELADSVFTAICNAINMAYLLQIAAGTSFETDFEFDRFRCAVSAAAKQLEAGLTQPLEDSSTLLGSARAMLERWPKA